MRFVLTAVIWLVMLGGLSLYIYQRDRHAPAPVLAPERQEVAGGDFTLEITPTFSPEPDPFALQGAADEGEALVVRTAGKVLFRAEALEPGVAVRISPVTGLAAGPNELYLQAQPPLGASPRDHAVRVRLLQGGRVVVDETLWGPSGTNVAGTIPFTLAEMAEEQHDH